MKSNKYWSSFFGALFVVSLITQCELTDVMHTQNINLTKYQDSVMTHHVMITERASERTIKDCTIVTFKVDTIPYFLPVIQAPLEEFFVQIYTNYPEGSIQYLHLDNFLWSEQDDKEITVPMVKKLDPNKEVSVVTYSGSSKEFAESIRDTISRIVGKDAEIVDRQDFNEGLVTIELARPKHPP